MARRSLSDFERILKPHTAVLSSADVRCYFNGACSDIDFVPVRIVFGSLIHMERRANR